MEGLIEGIANTEEKKQRYYRAIATRTKDMEALVANIVFSKETLFDRIWGMDALGDAATVTVHVNRLREKLSDDSSNPEYIETVWGVGYRFKV